MPEGHSLRRLAITFDGFFVGDRCALSSPQGRFTEGAATLDGRVMAEAFSYGKHLFLRFDSLHEGGGPLWLHTHLGLYGAWRFHSADGVPIEDSIGASRAAEETGVLPSRPKTGETSAEQHLENSGLWQPPEPVGAVRVRIATEQVAADLTGPTACQVLDAAGVEQILGRLGPDPLDYDTDPNALRKEFTRRVRTSRRPVGELVMDQSVSAGVGNIYRAEGLFRQGISPMRRGNNVSELRLKNLWDDFVVMLNEGVETGLIRTLREEDRPAPQGHPPLEDPGSEEGIAEGGSATGSGPAEGRSTEGKSATGRGPAEGGSAEGGLDPEASKWYVYKRGGRPCLKCGNPVRHRQVAGRNLFWCSTCQR